MGNTAKKDARRMDTAERQRRACELRRSGATYEQIGRALGKDKNNVRKDVLNAIAAIPREAAEEVLQLELLRLDGLWLGVWPKAKTGDVQAIRAAVAIMDRRAAYLGLDAPTKSELTGKGGASLNYTALTHEQLVAIAAGKPPPEVAGSPASNGVVPTAAGDGGAGTAPESLRRTDGDVEG